jgi:vancomycin permeability regulator SanA
MNTIEKLGILAGAVFIAGACTLSIIYGFTVGNAIALCFGAMLIAIGAWFRKLPAGVRKAFIITAASGMAFFLTITAIVIVNGCRNTVTFHEDAVLVLGCGIRGETVLPTLQSRLDRCLEYLNRNPGVPVVVSGGQGRNEDIPEAEAMKRCLVQNGVVEAQIIMEDRSRDTKDNFRYSKLLLDSLFAGKNYTVACITSDYHVFRIKKTARDEELNIRVYNAAVKWYLRPSAYCREALSICKSWL